MFRLSSAIVATLVFGQSALADVSLGEGRYGHMSGGYGYDGFGMFLGPVFMLVLLAALVVGIVALIRWMAPGSLSNSTFADNKALDTLKIRFASGEIDAVEFADRKKLLSH